MEPGLVKTLKVLNKRLDRSFTVSEIIKHSARGKKKTLQALDYLEGKGLIQKTPNGERWSCTEDARPAIDRMLAVYRKVQKRPVQPVLRGLLSLRPFRKEDFMERVRGEGFTRSEGLRFLNRERERGYLKEAVILFLGLQIKHLESFRFYGRVRFVGPGEFQSFRAECESKRLDLREEEFLVGHYPPAISGRVLTYLEKNEHRPLIEDPSTWFFVQEFRNRILSRAENPAYGICH